MKIFALKLIAAGVSLLGTAYAQAVLNDTPSRVVGQPSVTLRSANPNVVEGREFLTPIAVVVDRSSTPQPLYVSDFGNNRVLGWANAANFSNGAPADIVIGQSDKITTQPQGPGIGRTTGVFSPGALAVDARGNLYVADAGNNRILRFPKPFANQAEVQVPNLVIGQATFNTRDANSGGLSARSLAFSTSGGGVNRTGLAFDPQGNLWATDPLNHRVLRFPVAALGDEAANQPEANLVLGQPDFTTNTALPTGSTARLTKTGMRTPAGIAVDPAGNVFVSDEFGRVLVYATGFFNGKEATRLLGVDILAQGAPFTTDTNVLSAAGVFMVGDRAGIVDQALHRITIYDPINAWPPETEQDPSPPAKIVIGQADFTSNRSNRGLSEPSAITLSGPVSAFFNGSELFVADGGNHRVLAYPQVVSNATASRLLGQLTFGFNAPNLVEGTELFLFNGYSDNANLGGDFSDGAGVAVDTRSSPPRLYVADTFNNRVLGYRDARRVRPGDKADIVIGQADFNRVLLNSPQNNRDTPTDQGLFHPSGLLVDRNGDLFVADSGNGRVLRFASPFERVPAAGERYRTNLVLGQSGPFSARIADPSSRNMSYPFGLALTAEGHLLVSDALHNRVLFFRRPANGDFTNGMAAEKVIGQVDFLTVTRSNAPNRMVSPRHIATDTDDRLYVTDPGNNRVLIYDRIVTAPNDPNPALAIAGLGSPQGLFVSSQTGEIWVADTRRTRVSRYPRFELLALGVRTEQEIAVSNPLAVVQDGSGNLFVAEGTNRVSLFFNGLTQQVAGSYAERPISPGGIGILYPRAPNRLFTSETVAASAYPLPKEIADLQVLLNDQQVPLYFVSPRQINFLVPMSTADSGRAELQVLKVSTGEILAASNVELGRVSPALFIQGSSDQGQIAALNQDNSVNAPGNEAAKGSVVQLFGAGQGFIPNAPPDGTPPTEPVSTPLKPRVLIGTRFIDEADIQYSGLAPGMAGVWQINVRIPDFVAPDPRVVVVIEFASVFSNIGSGGKRLTTTIAVRP